MTWVRPRQAPSDEVQVFYLGARAAVNHVGAVLGGRYELLALLGCGGTAAVYRALDVRTKAQVAVKVLHAGAREAIGAYFQQEGRLTARISSPHLVRAHDFGEDDERLFIVFDLVPGEALASMFFGRVMPWRELCLVVLHVLDALAALHRLGIVHRDVKPDNVYVGRKLGGELHATLLDLGFALVPPERRLTNAPEPSRMVFGTEDFIAPELLAGLPPEPRSDLYSVGALMYTMLTAQPVPDLGACPEEMVLPSPRAFLPAIPAAVDDAVMRALSDVEDRFQDAAEMAVAIRAAMIAAEASAPAGGVLRPTAAELPRATVPTASASSGATGSAAEVPAGECRSAAEVPTTCVSNGAAGPAAEMSAASAAAGDAGLLVARTADPSAAPGAAASPQNHAARGRGRLRLAAACMAAWLLGAGSMYGVMFAVAPTGPQSDTPATACDPGPALVPAAPRVQVDLRASSSGNSDVGRELSGESARHTGAVTEAAIPARTASPTAGPAVPRRLPRAEQTFEQAMMRLEPRARGCARRAEIAEAPRTAIVRGDTLTGQVQSVQIVDMSQKHPFALCLAEAIREAKPPLRAKNNAYKFFSQGGSP
jgi:serine/threonine-protein kinase